jgi:hypothetical protein
MGPQTDNHEANDMLIFFQLVLYILGISEAILLIISSFLPINSQYLECYFL